MFLVLVFLLKLTQVDGLECYHCSGVRNVSECHTVVTCPADNMCFTEVRGTGDQMRFDLTCKLTQECHALPKTTAQPSSATGAYTTDCAQCCAKPACNTYLCSMGTSSVTSTEECLDDPQFDCPQLSSLLNICSDVQHAKAVCRDFCGLCNLDGAWSSWSSWGACSATCDFGFQSRTRTCDNPSPSRFGRDCRGNDFTQQLCNLRKCPGGGDVQISAQLDGAWSSWSTWGACSSTCDTGLQARTRNCTNPSPSKSSAYCQGNDVMQQLCNLRKCAEKKVAFSVYASSSTLTSDNTPTFRLTLLNTGSYNMTTGKFTCPVAGVYIFSLTLMHDGTNTGQPYCFYRVNGHTGAYIGSVDDAYDQASGTITVSLSVGDVVDLLCGDWEHENHDYGAMFSGALITPN